MEQSAFEALIIGVSVFVFITALTAGVLLMSNVIDMVNFANKQAIVGMNGTLAEAVGVVNERTYTGTQVLRYYREIIKNIEIIEKEDASGNIQTIEQDNNTYDFKIKLSENGQEKSIRNFVELSSDMLKYLDKEFILEYKGIKNDKHTYVFSLKKNSNNET